MNTLGSSMPIRLYGVVLALALAVGACTDATTTTDATTESPREADSPSGANAPDPEDDPRLDLLGERLDELAETLTAVGTAVDTVAASSDPSAAQDAAASAVALLTADPGLRRAAGAAPEGSDDIAPLLPGPDSSREETVDYGDVFTALLTAAREAGTSGGDVIDLLRDPLAGDVGSWQRDAEGQLDAVVDAVDDASRASVDEAEARVLELVGEAPRALAWMLLATRTDDLDRQRAYAERAQAHLGLIELALSEVRSNDGATE